MLTLLAMLPVSLDGNLYRLFVGGTQTPCERYKSTSSLLQVLENLEHCAMLSKFSKSIMETLRARLVEEENAEKRFSAEISPIQKPRTCPKPGSGPDKLNESRNRITKEDQELRDFQVFRINLCPKKFRLSVALDETN